jgi:hypothetical protein
MPAEASALCIALRRVGDDLAVVRFEAPAVLASQALTSPCSGHSTHAKRLVGQSRSQDVSAACGRAGCAIALASFFGARKGRFSKHSCVIATSRSRALMTPGRATVPRGQLHGALIREKTRSQRRLHRRPSRFTRFCGGTSAKLSARAIFLAASRSIMSGTWARAERSRRHWPQAAESTGRPESLRAGPRGWVGRALLSLDDH